MAKHSEKTQTLYGAAIEAYFGFWKARADHVMEIYERVSQEGEYPPKLWIPDVMQFYERSFDDVRTFWQEVLDPACDDGDGAEGESEAEPSAPEVNP